MWSLEQSLRCHGVRRTAACLGGSTKRLRYSTENGVGIPVHRALDIQLIWVPEIVGEEWVFHDTEICRKKMTSQAHGHPMKFRVDMPIQLVQLTSNVNIQSHLLTPNNEELRK